MIREAILHAEGFHVLSASKGVEGIALANEHNFDAIVLDYAMPDISGEEVASALKLAHPAVQHSSVLGRIQNTGISI